MSRIHTARKILKVAFGNVPTDASYTYTDLTPWLRDQSYNVKRGRQNELQKFDAGTASFFLKNNDRRFEPEYVGGAYYPNIDLEKPLQYSYEYPWLPGALTDGPFEYGTDGWTAANASVLWVPNSGWLYLGADALQLTSTVAGAVQALSQPVPCNGSEPWYGSIRVKPTAGESVQVQLVWYSDLAGTIPISTTSGTLTALSAGLWSRLEVAVTNSPSNARSVRLAVNWTTAAINDTLLLSHAVLDQVTWSTVEDVQFTGYTDSWMPTWNLGDNYVEVQASDAFKILGMKEINNRGFADTVKSQGWSYYWPLDDPVNSGTVLDKGASGAHYDIPINGSAVLGIDGPLIADPGSAMDLYGGVVGSGPTQYGTGWLNLGDAAAYVSGYYWSFSCWFRMSSNSDRLIQQGPNGDPRTYGASGQQNFWNLYTNSSSYYNGGFQWSGLDANGTSLCFNTNWGWQDNNWHFLTIRINNNSRDVYIFVDGNIVPCTNIAGGVIQSDGHWQASAPMSYSQTRFLLAGANDGPSFAGQLAHVMVSPPSSSGTVGSLNQHQALYNIGASYWPWETFTVRMNHVLDIDGWPAGLRNFDTVSTYAAWQIASIASTKTLDYLQQLEQSDGGWLHMDRNGAIRYIAARNLQKAPYSNVQWVVSQRGGETDAPTGKVAIAFSEVKPSYDDSILYNEAITSRQIDAGTDGPPYLAQDLASQGKYFKRSAPDQTGLLTAFDQDVISRGQWEMAYYSNPHLYFTSLTFTVYDDASWYMASKAKIGDRVAVLVYPFGGGAAIRKEVIIQGIQFTGQRQEEKVTYQLGMAPPTVLLLNDPVFGKLDSGNRMGY